jgi:UrcA family protein
MNIRILLASLALTTTAAPVLASSQDQVSVEVAVEDLDLSTQKDQKRLGIRVNRAAQKICRSDRIGVAARAIEMECVKVVLAKTRPQIEVAIANSRSRVRIATVQVNNGS